MTNTAVRSIRAIVNVFIRVTGNTLCWSALINSIGMALCAGKIRMFTYKREAGVVVIKGHISPAAGVMTGTTIRTKLSIMFIL